MPAAISALKKSWIKLLAVMVGSVVAWQGVNFAVRQGTGLARNWARGLQVAA